MKEAIVILTLLGCDHGEQNCDLLPGSERQYSTIEECESMSDALLADSTTARYPVMMARCESIPDQGLAASVPSPDMLASEIVAESEAASAAPPVEDGVVARVVAIRRLVTEPVTGVAKTATDATVSAAKTVVTKTRALVDAVNPF